MAVSAPTLAPRRICQTIGHDWPKDAPEPCLRCGHELQTGVLLGGVCCAYHAHGGAIGESCRPWPKEAA